MSSKKNYSRYFIILEEDEKGFGISTNKVPTGYSKIEIKDDKCKISYYVQNLKPDINKYFLVLICDTRNTKAIIEIGKAILDQQGRLDGSYEYDSNNISNTGISIGNVTGAAIVRKDGDNLISIMSGFTTKDTNKNWVKYDLFKKRQEDNVREAVSNVNRDIKDENIKDENIKSTLKEEEKESVFEEYEKKIEEEKNKSSILNSEEENRHSAKEKIDEVNKNIQTLNEKIVNKIEGQNNKKQIEDEQVIKKEKEDNKTRKDKDDKKQYKEEKYLENKCEKDKEKDKEKYEKEECENNKKKDKEKYEKEECEKDKKKDKEKYEKEECKKDKKKDKEKYEKEECEKDKKKDKEKYEKEECKKDKKKDKEKYEKEECEKDKKKDKEKYEKEYKSEYINYKNINEFFNKLFYGLEENDDLFYEIKNCKWYKININKVDELLDKANYYKYIMMYLPMICYYPYISRYKHFLMGCKYDCCGNIKYIIYAIPGTKQQQPYGGTTGFITWMPTKINSWGFCQGYWMLFYDFRKGNLLIPIKK